MKDTYAKMREVSKAIGEKNDCAVKAVAAVTGIEYEVAHTLLKKYGRKFGKGTPNSVTEKALAELGFKLVAFKSPFAGMRSFASGIWTHKPILVWVSKGRHIVGIKDKIVHDWTNNRCHRVHHCAYVLRDGEVEPRTPEMEVYTPQRTRSTQYLYALRSKNTKFIYKKFKRHPTAVVRALEQNLLSFNGTRLNNQFVELVKIN